MVTFVCEYCDLTLKKKQCDKHVMGRCRPTALICIDCSVTFRGNDYVKHISCISQMDKHWGQYAPSKQQNKNNNHQQQNNNNNHQQQQNNKNNHQQQNNNKIQQSKTQQQSNWLGWKNQIKAVLSQQKDKQNIPLEQIKTKVLKRYHEQFETTDKDQQIFMEKLQKLKKVKLVTYVQIQQ